MTESPIVFVYGVGAVDAAADVERIAVVDGNHIRIEVGPQRDQRPAWPIDADQLGALRSAGGPGLLRSDERYFAARRIREVVVVPSIGKHLVHVLGPHDDAESFLAAAAATAPNPITRGLGRRLGVAPMRYTVDGVLEVLTEVWRVRAVAHASPIRSPAWLTPDVHAAVEAIHRVDAMLYACVESAGLDDDLAPDDVALVRQALIASRMSPQ